MKKTATLSVALLITACGGGESEFGVVAEASAAEPSVATPHATPHAAPNGGPQQADWFHVNEAAKTVHMTVTAGLTNAKAYWNFNGGHDGNMTITVPEGFTITVDFVNQDPSMPHSLGISALTGGFGAMLETEPVFEGAITEDPASMAGATMPGESERIQFVASTAGEYSMVCYIPAHAATGMYVYFNVSADGTFGVEGG